MSISFAGFIASAVLGAVVAVISCHRAYRRLGAGVARKYGAVLALSLAAYVGTCVWLGYGWLPQGLALLAGCLPLWLGHKYVPSLDEMRDRS